jgi:hypothetical protein
MWVIPNTLNQPRSQRIGNNISRHLANILFPPDSPIEKSALPETALPAQVPVDGDCRSRFDGLHCFGQRPTLIELEQPVQMVRHNDPGKRNGITLLMHAPEFTDQ